MSYADLPRDAQFTPLGLANLPALAELGLSIEELDALRSQGFVGQETRYHRLYYKLRFRLHGKQRVRYIRGAACASAVQAELNTLQQTAHRVREITTLAREGATVLRASKASLEPLLEELGYYFHGREIRQRRSSMT